LKPSTIMSFHRSVVREKYQWLFTPTRRQKPGPKGSSPELVAAIIEMKLRNQRFGCPAAHPGRPFSDTQKN
jgi:hypothetical protein